MIFVDDICSTTDNRVPVGKDTEKDEIKEEKWL